MTTGSEVWTAILVVGFVELNRQSVVVEASPFSRKDWRVRPMTSESRQKIDHEVKVLSPWLTSFDGPTLKVSAADEVGRVHDLGVFAPNKRSEGNVYLYIWRLEGC